MLNLEKLKREQLPSEMQLLQMLEGLADDVGAVDGFKLEDLELELDISHNTIKRYLRAFRDAGALKFKFGGRIALNPQVFALKNHDVAIEKYTLFVSD